MNLRLMAKFWMIIHPSMRKGYYPYFSYAHHFGKLDQYMFPQIRGSYSFFDYDIHLDCFRYGSKNRRAMKKSLFVPGFIEDHHIIPRRFKNHSVIMDTNYDLNSCNNIIMMPSICASMIIKNDDILYHQTHYNYNQHVLECLTYIKNNSHTKDEKMYNLWLLVKDLELRICKSDKTLPWD